jgi:WD40 repeat protein
MGAPDGSVRLWDLGKKERIGGDRPTHAKSIWDLAVTPDKKWLITSDKDGAIKITRIDKANEVKSLKTAAGTLDGLIVSPDGSRLATYGDGRVELWDLAAGRSLRSWAIPDVRTVAFTPDGRQLLSGLDNSTLYLLDGP